ncbi:MAG: class I SAM-dependent methyltransferase, partial [Gammaproteobacteria bacterium]|nr:class I SAM-dependent methyltransferase [Gammaproteobacteria bacterium]
MMYGELCTKFYDADKQFASTEEVNFYKNIFNKNDLLLEPMCGSGRLLIPLMQAGFTVHGIDNSPEMLKSCKKRASDLGLQPTLYEETVDNMSLSQKYDGIVIPFGSFQLFYPRSNAYHALEIFKEHLKPKGKLVMDLFVPWDALYENNEEERGEREVKTGDIGGNSIIKINNHSKANKYEQFIISKTKYTELLDDKAINQEEEQMYIAWYYRYEMELILEKFGFKNIRYENRFLNKSDH